MSSSSFGRRSETFSVRTLREMARLTWVIDRPARLCEALISGRGRLALEEHDGPPLGGHRLEEQVQDQVEELGEGLVGHELARGLAHDGEHPVLAGSSAGSMAGLVLMSDSSRAEKTRVPSGSSSTSSTEAAPSV